MTEAGSNCTATAPAPTTAATSAGASSTRSTISPRSAPVGRGSGTADPRRRDRHPDRPERADLGAHGLQILRWRPAPVQATYLGFIGPVPLPELDFLLCDNFVIPPATRRSRIGRSRFTSRETTRPTTRKRGDRHAGNPRGRRSAGGHFRVLLLLQPLQNHRGDVRRLDGDPAPRAGQRCCGSAADNPWSPHEPARAGDRRWASIRHVSSSPSGWILPQYMARLALADLFLDTFPLQRRHRSPATPSAWGCR